MYQPFLRGKTALVTGGLGSIGEAICIELAKVGCSVAVNGRQDTPTTAIMERIKAAAPHHGKVIYAPADMKDRASMASMVKAVEAEFDRIDILVNCAGVQHVGLVDELPVEDWDDIIDVNLNSVFHMVQLVLPLMKQHKWGRIVNISSILGLVGNASKTAYSASKHAVIGLTKSVALETALMDITCNAVCPGFVDTPLLRKEIVKMADESYGGDVEKVTLQLMTEKQPSLQFVSPDAVGQAVVFLCSPAAKEMRGSALSIDGAGSAG
ncbi:putative mitochondrial NAD(P)-dependent oxidoreductase [Leptomonas pyrrhocoris]|uniref:3-oxoacyl-[acyl-carrier-protein] reductase n=1 Tax=Leptomonas pyrrhocoris TaxID=157538 RepID=A0A0M9FV64_LEPPY|nr:putative mitochondrial NAD(P)-dependent oxidoreductase [Leptomonas pyrrhocoris]KPA76607.1 putative mitochondrial NAD(P)-dependent oxidoreductase [Leptomonas pyrrhocoris]|eukprot:XP_015655046.1 putative mitochondrial NAD(P)-dependent oxidoreductase [Leptomonas pyrrhocoris]